MGSGEGEGGMRKVKFLCNVYCYRWFSRYVIAAMLVDGKQKIAH